MKRLLCMLMTVCTLTVTAQDEKNVTLNEVTVKGARVVQKVDGQWIYPTKQQIAASPNGCSLQAYLGRWTLGAYADNGWNFIEGEHRGHQALAI